MEISGICLLVGVGIAIINFYNACKAMRITPRDDHCQWIPEQQFSVKSVISEKTPPSPQVPWSKIVWSRYHLPRYAFILWIAFWKMLLTLQKLA